MRLLCQHIKHCAMTACMALETYTMGEQLHANCKSYLQLHFLLQQDIAFAQQCNMCVLHSQQL